jgi:hypothetical protein
VSRPKSRGPYWSRLSGSASSKMIQMPKTSKTALLIPPAGGATLTALKNADCHGSSDACKRKLLDSIGRGGQEAREVAAFFISNTQVKFERPMPGFWSRAVESDSGFFQNHGNLSSAVQDSLTLIKGKATGVPPQVDVNLLAQGHAQPGRLKSFKNNLGFSIFDSPNRRDALAYAIGGIQGHLISIIRFAGEPNGSYKGVLRYELIDHFGCDDKDLNFPSDAGQASLWLLQRKRILTDQSPNGCEPYRLRIKVEWPFEGHLF